MIKNPAGLKELLSAIPSLLAVLVSVFAPNAVIGFYRWLRMPRIEQLTPGLVRGMGVVGLTMLAMMIVLVAISDPVP
ncbi:MAG TPA: hypothetical protein VHW05_05130 [Phenylobacterium sp.]|nr:hypothetical protein [Phenylobacterium sp.]